MQDRVTVHLHGSVVATFDSRCFQHPLVGTRNRQLVFLLPGKPARKLAAWTRSPTMHHFIGCHSPCKNLQSDWLVLHQGLNSDASQRDATNPKFSSATPLMLPACACEPAVCLKPASRWSVMVRMDDRSSVECSTVELFFLYYNQSSLISARKLLMIDAQPWVKPVH